MDDLISRQAAIDAFNTNIDELVVSGKENADAVERYLNRVIDEIKQLPSAQPEIIRCKDCEHGVLDDGFPHQYFCVFKGDEWNNADYFCGHAKRREVTT